MSGEELNLITENGNYGFPMSHGGADVPEGTVPPIALYLKGDLQGMTYNDSSELPEKYRDCLYIASPASGQILRAHTKQGAESTSELTAEIEEFVEVPSPLDVSSGEDGALFASSFEDKKIYKISFEK